MSDVIRPLEDVDHPWGYASAAEWEAASAARDARVAALVPRWREEDEINLARRVQRAQEGASE